MFEFWMKSFANTFLFLCESSCSLEQINTEGWCEPLMVFTWDTFTLGVEMLL